MSLSTCFYSFYQHHHYYLFIPHPSIILTIRPISIAMFTSEQQLASIISSITRSHFPDRLLLTLYIPTDRANDCVMRRIDSTRQLHCVKKSVYPLNRLRNIAMRRVRTTHLFLLDMDSMMSRTYNHKISQSNHKDKSMNFKIML